MPQEPTPVSEMLFESLTPKYDEEQHGTYLKRLEEAVENSQNLNIALTGRYGAGKSSVLDKFLTDHAAITQRLAISSLAPGEPGESTTNRIQKEIVKQLLYGASEKVGRNSRFQKIVVLRARTAFWQSMVAVVCVGGLLYLLGWLPGIDWTGEGESTSARIAAYVGATLLATVVVMVARLLVHGRFVVKDLSAAGASVSLSENPRSFFDKYLDEIVHYFTQESKDIVVFEDLDRFNDPGIFEALRELNVLLNLTPKRQEEGATPLRFVYAVRDSIFAEIDVAAPVPAPPAGESRAAPSTDAAGVPLPPPAQRRSGDAAKDETARANRTKFFDVVIPMVPFISHRNARDLLARLLAERGITGIDRRLIGTVARHCTDMRLMRNMCNEYLVFAERLLEPKEPQKSAPGMNESHLFALVAYKNFHVDDFEKITRRESDLDRLYEFHQKVVRDSIEAKNERKRELLAQPDLLRVRTELAERLGERLNLYAAKSRASSAYGGSGHVFRVGSSTFDAADASGHEFWAAVAKIKSIEFLLENRQAVFDSLDQAAVAMFAPEGLDADRWIAIDAAAKERDVDAMDRDVIELRRANFADLVAMPRFTLTPEPEDADAGKPAPKSFGDLLTETLKSELACDLVRRGYIDRNFALYAAQFYGNFTGVDVATFMVQHVQPNSMAVNYDLSRPGAVKNLLNEAEDAGDDLELSVAAFNIDIVNYLLATSDPRATAVAENVINRWPASDAAEFLEGFFSSSTAERAKLASLLADRGWGSVLTYLASDESVPADARPELLDAAIRAINSDFVYATDEQVGDLITKHYREMDAFVAAGAPDPWGVPDPLVERVGYVLMLTNIMIPELDAVRRADVHEVIVQLGQYELTADNLRSAAGISGGVELDSLQHNEAVYERCIKAMPAYLAVVESDSQTGYAVTAEAGLVAALNAGDADHFNPPMPELSGNELAALLSYSSPDAALSSLRSVPEASWPAVAQASLFRPSLANVEAYRESVGSIDASLSGFLERAGTLQAAERADVTATDGTEIDREKAAVAILNAKDIPTEVRVVLAASTGATLPLAVDAIDPDGDLFAHLLERGMVADSVESFQKFRVGGWASIGPAIVTSEDVGTFMSPALVAGMVADVLRDTVVSAKVGHIILSDTDAYVPGDDWEALNAVAVYSYRTDASLTPGLVVRIARVAHDAGNVDEKLLLRLLANAAPDASATEILAVFEQLGPAYSRFVETGAKFKMGRDDSLWPLLMVLKAAHRISPRNVKDEVSITVL